MAMSDEVLHRHNKNNGKDMAINEETVLSTAKTVFQICDIRVGNS